MASNEEKEKLRKWLEGRGTTPERISEIMSNPQEIDNFLSVYKDKIDPSSGSDTSNKSSGSNVLASMFKDPSRWFKFGIYLIIVELVLFILILPQLTDFRDSVINFLSSSISNSLSTIAPNWVDSSVPISAFLFYGAILGLSAVYTWWISNKNLPSGVVILSLTILIFFGTPPLVAFAVENAPNPGGSLSQGLDIIKCGLSLNFPCQTTQSQTGPPAPPSQRTGSAEVLQLKLGSPATNYQLPTLLARSDYSVPVSIENTNTLESQIVAKNFYIKNAFIENGNSMIMCGSSSIGFTGQIAPQDQKSGLVNFNGKTAKTTSGDFVNCATVVGSNNPLSSVRFKFPVYGNACTNNQDQNQCLSNTCNYQCYHALEDINKKYGVKDQTPSALGQYDSARYLSSTNECECNANRIYNIMDELCTFKNDEATVQITSNYEFTGTGKGEMIAFKTNINKNTQPKLTSGPGPIKVTVYFFPDTISLSTQNPVQYLYVNLLNEGQGIAKVTSLKFDNLPEFSDKIGEPKCTNEPTPTNPYPIQSGKSVPISCEIDTANLKNKVTGDFLTIVVIASVDYSYSQDYSQKVPITVVHEENDKLGQLKGASYYCEKNFVVYGVPEGQNPSTAEVRDLTKTTSTGSVIWSSSSSSPTITQLNNYLVANGASMLQNKGQVFYDLGTKYGINPSFAIAVAQAETSLGKSGTTVSCNNFFNLESSPLQSGRCPGNTRFAIFSTADNGIEAFYKLIKENYVPNGQNTPEKINCESGSGFTSNCYCGLNSCPNWLPNINKAIAGVQATSSAA